MANSSIISAKASRISGLATTIFFPCSPYCCQRSSFEGALATGRRVQAGLPSRLVDSTIAASVVLASMNNIVPLFHERRWTMAFAFGLVHGFGFASVLSDLGLPQNALVLALVAFNVGVEAGQLAIVAAFLPAAFVIRRTLVYRRLVLLGGSLAIAILAAVWLVERTFDLKLLPF